MKINPKEFKELCLITNIMQQDARTIERERANSIINEEAQKLRARVMQCTQALLEAAKKANSSSDAILLTTTASMVRDMLDDRPDPASDPDSAKRFPAMFRGGPVS